MTKQVRKLVFAALCLALCLLLPFLTGQIPQIGQMLSPMHFPVFFAAFLCGPMYAGLVGAVAPSLRYLLFSMPPLYLIGTAMSFEMAAYGISAALLYRALPKKPWAIYAALAASMLIGRAVWGVAMWATLGSGFGFEAFMTGAFANAVPAIVAQLIVVPLVVIGVQRAMKQL